MTLTIYDIVGSIGVVVIIVTYALLQAGRLSSSGLLYSTLNAIGAGLIIISLVFNFNLAAFVVEFFWLLISIYGIYKSRFGRG